jgi:hypothetical protein
VTEVVDESYGEGDAEDRVRVETVDLTHDDLSDMTKQAGVDEDEEYRPPSYSGRGSSAYDKDIDHVASVLTSKSKSSSSTRPATLAQVLSGHSSEAACSQVHHLEQEQRSYATQFMSFSCKAARFMGLVVISTDEEEDEDD